jgi:hypothetical protein
LRGYSELRHSLFDFAVQLFDVDVQPIAIDGTVRLKVEDPRECVAAYRLLVDRAFNHVNRVLVRLVPLIREVRIFP